MSNDIRSEKIKFLIIGLLLGLLIGGSFFIFKLNDLFTDFNKLKNIVHSTKDTVITIIPAQNNTVIADKKSKNNLAEPSKVNVKKADTIVRKNTVSAKNNADTLTNDSLYTTDNADSIVVKTDMLLTTHLVPVKNLDAPISQQQLHEDSLLAKVSDTKNEAVASPYFRIEYWSSPLNYKGYRMSKNKILLYGIDSTAALKLFQKNGIIYLKTPEFTYKLEYTDGFRQYEKTSEKIF